MAKLKVLVVDDSVPVQMSLGRLLGGIPGVEIVGYAEDVASALALIGSQRPQVVILDVELRDGDKGIDVLRHVTRECPGTKIVALSNFAWSAMRESYLAAGASAYFDKSTEFHMARDWVAGLLPRPPAEAPTLATPRPS